MTMTTRSSTSRQWSPKVIRDIADEKMVKAAARDLVMREKHGDDVIASLHELAVNTPGDVSFIPGILNRPVDQLEQIHDAIRNDGFKHAGKKVHDDATRVVSDIKKQVSLIKETGTYKGIDLDVVDAMIDADVPATIVEDVLVDVVPSIHVMDVGGHIDVKDGIVFKKGENVVLQSVINKDSLYELENDEKVDSMPGRSTCIVHHDNRALCIPAVEGTGKGSPRYGWGFDLSGFDSYKDWRAFLARNNITSVGSNPRSVAKPFSDDKTYGEYCKGVFGDTCDWLFKHPSGIRIQTEHPGRKNKIRPDFDGFVGFISVSIPAGKMDVWNEIRNDFMSSAKEVKGEDPFELVRDQWLLGGRK